MTESTITEDLAADDAVDLHADTLKADLTAVLLDRIKTLPKPWQQMPAAERQEVIIDLEAAVSRAIRSMTKTIATQGRTAIVAECATVNNDGKKIVAKLTISTHDANRHDLLDAVGDEVLLVVGAGADQFLGGDSPKPDPDELGLPWDGNEVIDDNPPVFDSTSHGDRPGSRAKPRKAAPGEVVV